MADAPFKLSDFDFEITKSGYYIYQALRTSTPPSLTAEGFDHLQDHLRTLYPVFDRYVNEDDYPGVKEVLYSISETRDKDALIAYVEEHPNLTMTHTLFAELEDKAEFERDFLSYPPPDVSMSRIEQAVDQSHPDPGNMPKPFSPIGSSLETPAMEVEPASHYDVYAPLPDIPDTATLETDERPPLPPTPRNTESLARNETVEGPPPAPLPYDDVAPDTPPAPTADSPASRDTSEGPAPEEPPSKEGRVAALIRKIEQGDMCVDAIHSATQPIRDANIAVTPTDATPEPQSPDTSAAPETPAPKGRAS